MRTNIALQKDKFRKKVTFAEGSMEIDIFNKKTDEKTRVISQSEFIKLRQEHVDLLELLYSYDIDIKRFDLTGCETVSNGQFRTAKIAKELIRSENYGKDYLVYGQLINPVSGLYVKSQVAPLDPKKPLNVLLAITQKLDPWPKKLNVYENQIEIFDAESKAAHRLLGIPMEN